MGYRSDVYIAIDAEIYFAHEMGINGHLPLLFKEADSINLIKKDENSYHLITFSSIKWYESYSYVKEVTNLLNKYIDSNQAAYAVAGEDWDDYEEYGDIGYYEIEIVHSSPTIYHPELN